MYSRWSEKHRFLEVNLKKIDIWLIRSFTMLIFSILISDYFEICYLIFTCMGFSYVCFIIEFRLYWLVRYVVWMLSISWKVFNPIFCPIMSIFWNIQYMLEKMLSSHLFGIMFCMCQLDQVYLYPFIFLYLWVLCVYFICLIYQLPKKIVLKSLTVVVFFF